MKLITLNFGKVVEISPAIGKVIVFYASIRDMYNYVGVHVLAIFAERIFAIESIWSHPFHAKKPISRIVSKRRLRIIGVDFFQCGKVREA